jgi:acetyl-CoA carboxylase carboxyltransferase component
LLQSIETKYRDQMTPYYAAARLWVDELIDPATTRQWISKGLEMANHNPEWAVFNPGVIQT